MINKRKQKRRLKKSLNRMKKDRLNRAWKNLLEKRGYFNGKSA